MARSKDDETVLIEEGSVRSTRATAAPVVAPVAPAVPAASSVEPKGYRYIGQGEIELPFIQDVVKTGTVLRGSPDVMRYLASLPEFVRVD